MTMPDDTTPTTQPEADAPAETGGRSKLAQVEKRIAAEKGVDDTPVRACARRGLRVWRQSEASLDTSTHGRVCARHGVL